MMEKLADYHIHTSFCNHANGTMKQFVKFAIKCGLKEIGFSDHCPLPVDFNNQYRMLPGDLQIYLNVIRDLQSHFPQINVKIGIELDYIEGAVDYLRQFVTENGFDYILGSVHYLDLDSSQKVIYLNDLHYEEKSLLFCKYFETVKKAIQSGLFDIIAHFDLPRRFWGELNAECISYAEEALQSIKNYDLCLEINTSGFRTRNVEEPFPGRKLLQLAREMKIPITLGSDSHSPHDVGSYFHEATDVLKQIGFKDLNFFNHRQRQPVPL